jgi:CubicO group peptidase (beta-lactamase class C family)
VAGLASGGSITDWASFGSASPGGEPLSDRTPFYVASIAKQFTAAVIAVLASTRRLSLNDSVQYWLPELHESWEPVKLHHLLAHSGGLPNGIRIDAHSGWGVSSNLTTWDRIASIVAELPESPPGIVHRYSNHGYVLLAGVAERAANERFGDFARKVLFEPSGMSDSRFLDTAGVTQVPGWIAGKNRVDIQFSCCGDGGLVTTLTDLARWDGWLPTSRLAPLMLSERPALPNGRVAHDAWGISIRRHHGLMIESHGGTIDGYTASFVRFPSATTTIIVLANTDYFGTEDLGKRTQRFTNTVLDVQLDYQKPAWTQTHGDPPSA